MVFWINEVFLMRIVFPHFSPIPSPLILGKNQNVF